MIMCAVILYDVMQIVLPFFSGGEGCVALSMHPEEYSPCEDCEQTMYQLLYTIMCK